MKTPISSLYQDKLIDLAGQAVKLERLELWDTTATAVSESLWKFSDGRSFIER
jgi:hypothetical protein